MHFVQLMFTPLDTNSPVSSLAPSPPSSASSTPSSSSSEISSGCHTPERVRTPDIEIVDDAFAEPDDKDGDYLPIETIVRRRLFNKTQEYLTSQKNAEPNMKRKATHNLVRPFNDASGYLLMPCYTGAIRQEAPEA
jgi:hypothetical protein